MPLPRSEENANESSAQTKSNLPRSLSAQREGVKLETLREQSEPRI